MLTQNDLSNFWDESEYTYCIYTGPPIKEEDVHHAERKLGYILPQSYIELLKNKNGGVPKNTCFPLRKTKHQTKDHIKISSIQGINDHKLSLLGTQGSQFMIVEWGYPKIGIVICDCPSGGHDVVMLDYRKNKLNKEPSVVHVDISGQQPKITRLANCLGDFILGLVHKSAYEPSVEAEIQQSLEKVNEGSFSPVLCEAAKLIRNHVPNAEHKLRLLGRELVERKHGFNLHNDNLSFLMYDFLFLLFSQICYPKSREYYLEGENKERNYQKPFYALMVALNDGQKQYGFCTEGYCVDFVRDWWNDRLAKSELIEISTGYTLSQDAKARIIRELDKLERGIFPDSSPPPTLPMCFEAIKSGKDALFRYYLDQGTSFDISQTDTNGMTMLHYAALWGKSELCKSLIEIGADLSAKANCGITPLQCALKSHDEKTVLLLRGYFEV